MQLPADRALRLQALARSDEGFILGMAYSTQRGYARNHAFVGELRIGMVPVEMEIPELGFAIEIGELEVTDCETVNQFSGSKSTPAQFTPGYGLVFGQTERCAGTNWARTILARRRRMKSLCSLTATIFRRLAFWSISNCRIMWIFNPSWNWCVNCAARRRLLRGRRRQNE